MRLRFVLAHKQPCGREAWRCDVLTNTERCRRKAAECEEMAAHMHDPAARLIARRAARRWRDMAEDPEQLAHLVRMLSPPASGDE